MGNQKATRLKKKKGPGIDFKRVKSKVGKKLPRADNFTRTDFKAKALHLPDQSVTASKGTAVTSRNLSLQELLGQASHYNAHSRKDSLGGLQELLQAHPALLPLHTAAIIEKIAPRIADGDRAVREALLGLLSKTVLPALPEAVVAPFFPVLAVHVCNGLTHMTAEVRLSSVAFLDLLIARYPALLRASPLHAQIEDHYVTLLSITGPFGRTPASLLKVLSSLHSFLQASQPAAASQEKASQTKDDMWQWGRTRASSLHGNRSAVGPKDGGRWPRDGEGAADSPGDARGAVPPLAARLVPRLLDCWSECTPAALAVKPDPPTAQSLVRIARVLHLLLDHESISGQSIAQEYLPQLTHKVAAQFPVAAPGVRVSAHDIEDLVDLNLAVCQLMLPFFGGVGAPPWEGALVEYLQGVLEGRVLPGSGKGLAHGLEKRALTEAQTGVVLASLGQLLRVVGEEERSGLLAAFTRFYLGCGPQSRSKAAALHFMGGLLQDESTFSLVPPAGVQQWLSSLPRLLWELRSASPPASHQVLLLLLRSARAASPEGPLASTIAALQPSLLPFVCLTVPPKKQGSGETRKFGPFVSLPEKTQALAVDLLPHLGALAPALISALAHCCGAPGVGVQVVLRLLQVLHHCAAAADTLTVATYLSFLVTLLAKWSALAHPGGAPAASDSGRAPGKEAESREGAATTSGSREAPGGKESEALLDGICAGLARAGGGAVVLSLVGPLLAKLLLSASGEQESESRGMDVWAVYAVLRAVSTCSEERVTAEPEATGMPAELAALLPSAVARYWLEVTSATSRGTGWLAPMLRPCVFLLRRQSWLLAPVLEQLMFNLDGSGVAQVSGLDQEVSAVNRGRRVLASLLRLFAVSELESLLVDCRVVVDKLLRLLQKLVQGSGQSDGQRASLLREDLAKLEARAAVLYGQRTFGKFA
ncbi:hypothetical protein KFL_004860050 [Klebsormidium nitens]|uniref:Uncharacterized protein n=1 Tax=Klebsormidium nitens TaxID=105231 RepID=A0A1Y1IK93_KLENI|nr:hypothetical protein KFL_004860050 [Klebsormidium nitens]|eukprot:GAQ89087.1 hypothetical protein KFL_004860050 [Klebsormidium nitens]